MTQEKTYPRMRLAADQREWVRLADKTIPKLERDASEAQRRAAESFASWDAMTLQQKRANSFFFPLISDKYAEARRLTFQLIYYRGMREANL